MNFITHNTIEAARWRIWLRDSYTASFLAFIGTPILFLLHLIPTRRKEIGLLAATLPALATVYA